jgi:isopenicillin-N epimerase
MTQTKRNTPAPNQWQRPAVPRSLWPLAARLDFLNHGSFGSCPKPVLTFQQRVRKRMERQPVQFFVRDLEACLDQAREELARFVGADAEDLVFVPNATTGVNAVLRSLRFQPGDELIVTNHEYNACRNALDYVAACRRARVVVADIPFPLRDAGQVHEAIARVVSPRTRLALLDHITSQTALILPVQELVAYLRKRGIETLVDGAHAPGMLPLHLDRLGAAYYTGNCHKWLCAPKGAGFLHVRRDRQEYIRPTVISHGANSPRRDRSRFLIEFGWTGTWDPSAWLSVPEAIRFMKSLLPGGWAEIMRHNHALTVAARRLVCGALGQELPCPDRMLGAMASLPLPPAAQAQALDSPLYADPLQEQLLRANRIEVPVIPWPAPPGRLLRFSCQLYNAFPQYERLAQALRPEASS